MPTRVAAQRTAGRGLARVVVAVVFAASALAASAMAQPVPRDRDAAIAAWLASAPPRDQLRDAAAQAILDDGDSALTDLADRLRAAERDAATEDVASRRRAQALQSLTVQVALLFIERAQASRMVFAGQYDALRLLQPWVGRLCTNLLLDTPDWYPVDRRARLLPVLRDVLSAPPGRETRAALRALADDDREAADLRAQVAFALWQWGDREPAENLLTDLRQRLTSDSADERLAAHRELARAHYELRAYPAAARQYRAFLRAAERAEFRLVPFDYYNAACSAALAGDTDAALDELAGCIDLMTRDRTDVSLRVPAALFVTDPELAPVRALARFQRITAAVPAADANPRQPEGGEQRRR